MAPQIISSIPQQISAVVDVKIPLDIPTCPTGNPIFQLKYDKRALIILVESYIYLLNIYLTFSNSNFK